MKPINFPTSNALLKWQPAAVLRVTGADAATFLQGQFTNDLRASAEAMGAVYGLWLTVKGKVLADSFVVRDVDAFWIVSYFSAASVIRERLEAYVIADDVVIEDRTADLVGVSVLGDRAREEKPAGESDISFWGRRSRQPNREWLIPRATEPDFLAQFADYAELDAAAAEAMRIAEGIPAVPVDVGPADLPNEAGLEGDAISYTKGCYLGQEVMARLKSMGQVRRKLMQVQIESNERPVERAALFFGDRIVGELRSVAKDPGGHGFIGLAMVSLLHGGANRRFALAPGATPNVSVLPAP